ncbi:fic/DOC family protein [Elaphomyces granulatus]
MKLLRKIYARFDSLKPGSKECWYEHADPGNMDKLGYKALEKKNSRLLQEIDKLRDAIKTPIPKIAQTLVPEYAYQSVLIENNPLKMGESLVIANALADDLFRHVALGSLTASSLLSIELPAASKLLPTGDQSAVAEMRNHVVASQWIADTASRFPKTAGISEDELRSLAAFLHRDTASEILYTHGWGKRINPGDYRQAPIGVRSNPLRIFPYHMEILTLMKEFFDWHKAAHHQKSLHPLLLACHSTIYFLSIHPFVDGNGRAGRTFMHDYMVRQGYFPVVMQNLEREDYLRIVSNSQDRNSEEFVDRVLDT